VIATIVIDSIRDTIDESPPTNGTTDTSTDKLLEPILILYILLDNITSLSDSNPPEQIVSNNCTISTIEVSAISTIPPSDKSISSPSLDKQSPLAEPGIAANTEATTNSPLLEVDISVEQLVLDVSSTLLERVLVLLKIQDTDCIDNSILLGKYRLLTNTDPIASTRIITSIGINCINSIFLSLALVLEIKKR
jgi:hypothetical protein